MQGRKPKTPLTALVEKEDLELTELDEGKLRELLQGVVDAQEQLHKETITRHEA